MLFTSSIIALLTTSLAIAAPTLESRSGWCGLHVIQYQRNEYGIGADYEFDATLKDPTGKVIGSLNHAVTPGNMDSALPYVLVVRAGSGDYNPVDFEYAGQRWLSNSAQCTTGDYDLGSRNMDCGFTC